MTMKSIVLSKEYNGRYFFISPITGNLCVGNQPLSKKTIPQLIKKALDYCENPYTLNSTNFIERKISLNSVPANSANRIDRINKNFLWLGNRNFLVSSIYSSFQNPFFESTIDAFDYISQMEIHKEKFGELCLQRALLAAKISKSFKKNGVIFIGATLPTFNMHAWIIEGDIQPDREDRIWVMYQPLLALYF